MCSLSQYLLQLQSVCSYIFSINCSIYTAKKLNFIFHSNHSDCLFRYFYVLLLIILLMSLWTVMYITINNRQLQWTTSLLADVWFVALETADNADVKTSLAAMKDGRHGVITVPHIVIFSTGRGKCWVWRTGRFTPGENVPFIYWIGGLWGPQGPYVDIGKGRFFSPNENQSTIVRLSSHYPSYCTKWAIRSNTYEFISWLSRMYTNC